MNKYKKSHHHSRCYPPAFGPFITESLYELFSRNKGFKLFIFFSYKQIELKRTRNKKKTQRNKEHIKTIHRTIQKQYKNNTLN